MNNFKKEHDIVITQYNKVRDTINSIDKIEQVNTVKRMIRNLTNLWITEVEYTPIKTFAFVNINEPCVRIYELENLLLEKKNELTKHLQPHI